MSRVDDLLDDLSKRCPKCKGTQLSSKTVRAGIRGEELWHRCLDCGWKGRDEKTLPSLYSLRLHAGFKRKA